MADNFPGSAADATSSAVSAIALSKSDSAEFDVTRALYVGVTGDVKVTMKDGSQATFKAAPVGILPVRVKQLLSTGTTATDVLALY